MVNNDNFLPSLMEVMEVDLEKVNEPKSERFVLMMEPSIIEAIDDWGFSNRVRTRSEAIRRLVRKGMEATQAETKKADVTA